MWDYAVVNSFKYKLSSKLNWFNTNLLVAFFWKKILSIKSIDNFLDELFPIVIDSEYTEISKNGHDLKKNKNLNLFSNEVLYSTDKFYSRSDKKNYRLKTEDERDNYTKEEQFYLHRRSMLFFVRTNFLGDYFFQISDIIFLQLNYYIFQKSLLLSFFKNNKLNLKLIQTKNNFIYNFSNTTYKNNLLLFGYGLKFLWKGLRFWVFSTLIGVSIVYYCMVIKLLPFNKIVFQWFLITMFFYWLVSGFVFFIKKYQYRYFTSSIQRFWRRSFILFWAIEGFLFCIFLYLTINSNNEPVFMYDNSQVYKTHLFSWRYFLIKIFPATLLIIFSYFVLLSLKWNIFSKSNFLCLLITILLLFIMWQEFYQFFHILSYYGNLNWVYDMEEHLWNLEVEFRRTRIVNHYVTIVLAAKFWHLVFVLGFWLFFILRCLEIERIRYPLFSANFQNFIIVYIMSWAYMYPWFKYIWKKFIEMPYFWFYVNTRKLGIFIFFNDIKLFYISISNTFFNFFYIFDFNFYFNNFDFFYWHNSCEVIGYSQYKKNYIRDNFIKNIYN